MHSRQLNFLKYILSSTRQHWPYLPIRPVHHMTNIWWSAFLAPLRLCFIWQIVKTPENIFVPNAGLASCGQIYRYSPAPFSAAENAKLFFNLPIEWCRAVWLFAPYKDAGYGCGLEHKHERRNRLWPRYISLVKTFLGWSEKAVLYTCLTWRKWDDIGCKNIKS